MNTHKKDYFSIRAKGPKKGEIEIYEPIGDSWFSEGMGAKRFSSELKGLGDIDQLDIRINSPGGSVFEGNAIYNILKAHKAEKTVYIDGIAASIASVIAMAGDTVVMPENSIMMIHDPFGFAQGTAEDMRKMAEALDKVKAGIILAYVLKTGMTDKDISELMFEETWMTAQEAKEWGFADQVAPAVKIAAHFDLGAFTRMPQNIAKALSPSQNSESGIQNPEEQIEQDLALLRTRPQSVTATTALSDAVPASHNTRITTPTTEVKTMATLSCKDCGTPLVDDACPRCSIDAAVKNAQKQAREAEITRAKEIRDIGKQFGCENLAERAIQDGWTVEQLRTEILNRMQAAKNANQPLGTFVTVEAAHNGKPFRNFGEQLVAIRNSAVNRRPEKRLMEVSNAITGASETVDSDGGFLVQTDFSTALLQKANETQVIAPRCFHVPISGNRLEAPIVDESTRATGSRWGGVRVYRVAEGGTATKAKPKFAMLELKLEKMMGLCYATDELLADASALEAIVTRAFTEELAFKVDDEIINGTGTGEMLGILASPCIVSQTKETGQTAATVVAENVMKMYARMPARLVPGAAWFINQEVWPQLFSMQLTIGTGGVPLFMPPGGLSVAPYGTLMGRPIVPIEQAAALGTVGDIIFGNFGEYAIIEKGGINAQQSIHVQFLTDEMTFRWIVRNNGMPVWKTPLTPYKGSATQSPFIVLATRA